jgi:hypothetical protein
MWGPAKDRVGAALYVGSLNFFLAIWGVITILCDGAGTGGVFMLVVAGCGMFAAGQAKFAGSSRPMVLLAAVFSAFCGMAWGVAVGFIISNMIDGHSGVWSWIWAFFILFQALTAVFAFAMLAYLCWTESPTSEGERAPLAKSAPVPSSAEGAEA